MAFLKTSDSSLIGVVTEKEGKIEKKVVCPHCKTLVKEGTTTCPSCGGKIDGNQRKDSQTYPSSY